LLKDSDLTSLTTESSWTTELFEATDLPVLLCSVLQPLAKIAIVNKYLKIVIFISTLKQKILFTLF
jgi:hypothetical protein